MAASSLGAVFGLGFLGVSLALAPFGLRAARAKVRALALGPPTRRLLGTIATIVCDCDGVLFAHGTAVAGVPETLNACKRAGKRVLFVTNSATQSRKSLRAKLAKLGFDGVEEADCVTSASAAAAYLHQYHRETVKTAYCVGEQGLIDELALVGIRSIGPEDTGGMQALVDERFADAPPGEVDAVVVGLQMERLCYARLAKASAYARDRSRPFVATNLDENWPGGLGALLPAGGACVSFVAYAAERTPDVNVGKPSRDLARLLIETHGLDPRRTLMVGDRCNTDIAFGNSVGMRTMLVLSGCHTLADACAAPRSSCPDFVAPSLACLRALIDEA
jgi:phosphoglycolate/pyridoxal phosphate phosphatase family enzyme